MRVDSAFGLKHAVKVMLQCWDCSRPHVIRLDTYLFQGEFLAWCLIARCFRQSVLFFDKKTQPQHRYNTDVTVVEWKEQFDNTESSHMRKKIPATKITKSPRILSKLVRNTSSIVNTPLKKTLTAPNIPPFYFLRSANNLMNGVSYSAEGGCLIGRSLAMGAISHGGYLVKIIW